LQLSVKCTHNLLENLQRIINPIVRWEYQETAGYLIEAAARVSHKQRTPLLENVCEQFKKAIEIVNKIKNPKQGSAGKLVEKIINDSLENKLQKEVEKVM
jgi:hypothetical protein